ncbi:protease [Bacillus phage vB_BanS_Nate]|uniref:Serine peptidase S8 n=1 Tax=Bacillus phage vB_BanS_Nate TaxID=2894788 RepID=A0AAE8YUH8_9CAUD|nr:protease [Bacillus phage vB_BanS_Nate]UGO51023.1 serine peptidase S8 [Bacillus phage vB_BanS_Nate]
MMTNNETRQIHIYDGLPKRFKMDWALKAINVEHAWKSTKGKGVKVLVIDTGADENHPELKGKIKYGINMFKKNNDITDMYGHGTHVSGLIAGSKTGVAPEVDLFIAKVLDDKGEGSMASVMDGITLAINFEVDILCMSLGIRGGLPIQLEQRILEAHAKGINIVCAVGNMDLPEPDYPAFMDEVIAVGGVDDKLKHLEFSNRGAQVDISAPALDILSAFKDGKYAQMTGTSMASPLVAGAIALLIAHNRDEGIELTNKQVKEKIKSLGQHSYDYGYGVLDLKKLLD